MIAPSPIACPKCGSEQITSHPRGISRAGRYNVIVTCLNCGKQWWPGKLDIGRRQTSIFRFLMRVVLWSLGALFVLMVLGMLAAWLT